MNSLSRVIKPPFYILLTLLVLLAVPVKAESQIHVIFPIDGITVRTATITVFGVLTEPGKQLKLDLNAKILMIPVQADGRFSQSIRISPGMNSLIINNKKLRVYYKVGSGKSPTGFFDHYIHPAAEDDCENCHNFESRGDLSVMDEGDALCFNCHDDPSEGVKVRHDALDDGCTACHDPHMGVTKTINILPVPELCYECHDDVLESAGDKGSLHPPAEDGDCLDCHNPHGGNAALMTTGEICFECHDPFEKPGKGSIHDPVEGGECAECHSPHSSPGKHLLREKGSALCYTCHDEFEMPSKGSIHDPVDGGECLECHNPHISDNKTLLVEEGVNLCYMCHDEFEMPSKGSIHDPVDGGECSECHRPHVSSNDSLLTEGGIALCYMCHDEFEGEVIHSPIADDDSCIECHNPHIAARSALLVESGMKLCRNCHKDPVDRLIFIGVNNPKVHSPIADDEECLPCHSPHAAGKSLLVESQPGLCYQCHDDVTKDKKGKEYRFIHGPIGMGMCTACHRPHASKNGYLLDQKGIKICLACHDDPGMDTDGDPWLSSHPPVEEDCMGCHDPHATNERGHLHDEPFELCITCHSIEHEHTLDASRVVNKENTTVHLPPFFPLTWNNELVCTGCHKPHGSNDEHLQKATGMVLCMNCH